MEKEEAKARTQRFTDTFGDFLDKYEEANPEWMRIGLLQILYGAIENLKRVIEDPEEKEITWERPVTELRYPVQADWEKLEPLYFSLTAADLEDPERLQEAFVKGFMTVKEVYVLRGLTREILVILKGGKAHYKVPLYLDKKLDKLPKKDRDRRLERILKPVKKTIRLPLYDDDPSGKRQMKACLAFRFSPCVLDVDEERAYYPIVIGLELRSPKPGGADAGLVSEILEALLRGTEEAIPKEDMGFLKEPRPEPTARPVTKEASLVKVGLHAELQKFGHKPDLRQADLFSTLLPKTREEIEEKKVEAVGLDITQAQNQALFAIQKLMSATDYLGNLPGRIAKADGFSFEGFLPSLGFTPSQYLEAYGATKFTGPDGIEVFSGKQREDAMRALKDLAYKPVLWVYRRTYWTNVDGKRELKVDRIEKISPILMITQGWKGLTKYEDQALDRRQPTAATDEKLMKIAVELAPIFIQDINTYFILKPANCLQEISIRFPHKRPMVIAQFIEWLIAENEIKQRKNAPQIIEVGLDVIASALRLEPLIRQNRWDRIRQIVRKTCLIAKELGYLISFETIQGKTKELERLVLNPEKFSRVREIAAERKRLDAGSSDT